MAKKTAKVAERGPAKSTKEQKSAEKKAQPAKSKSSKKATRKSK